jgi:four helix bundle protein
VYQLTEKFPANEQYGLSSQMRRAAVSISSNIAEGKYRGYDKEFKRFLSVAYGSGGELETQIEISKRLFGPQKYDFDAIDSLLSEIMKMLNSLQSRPAKS